MTIVTLLAATIAWSAPFSFQMTHADRAYSDYQDATMQAEIVQHAVHQFLADPTEDKMAFAKSMWTEARKVYSRTEIHRFYGGPIDNDDGPEGLINAWPLDEAYIDYVKGDASAGIINQTALYPQLTRELLIELNERDGEKNISTGWHAIEFLLWGQDFSVDGPGERPVSDFIVGVGTNAERRRQYLKIVTDLLVEHLTSVRDQWNPSNLNSYYHEFVGQSEAMSLTNVFTSLVSMSADELAIERMFVAYDTQLQEDEHSCFSDTTHFDLLYNFRGIRRVWNTVDETTNVAQLAPVEVAKIKQLMVELNRGFVNFPLRFDQAIYNQVGRARIEELVDGLQDLGENFQKVALALGLQI